MFLLLLAAAACGVAYMAKTVSEKNSRARAEKAAAELRSDLSDREQFTKAPDVRVNVSYQKAGYIGFWLLEVTGTAADEAEAAKVKDLANSASATYHLDYKQFRLDVRPIAKPAAR